MSRLAPAFRRETGQEVLDRQLLDLALNALHMVRRAAELAGPDARDSLADAARDAAAYIECIATEPLTRADAFRDQLLQGLLGKLQ